MRLQLSRPRRWPTAHQRCQSELRSTGPPAAQGSAAEQCKAQRRAAFHRAAAPHLVGCVVAVCLLAVGGPQASALADCGQHSDMAAAISRHAAAINAVHLAQQGGCWAASGDV